MCSFFVPKPEPCVVLQATNIALNNLSLVLISLSLNQVIRCAGFACA